MPETGKNFTDTALLHPSSKFSEVGFLRLES